MLQAVRERRERESEGERRAFAGVEEAVAATKKPLMELLALPPTL